MQCTFYIITVDNIMQFGDVKKTGSIVYLQYVGGNHTQKDCYCTASTTSSHDLQVYAVDVRFQKYGLSSGNCDGGDKSYLYLSDDNQNSTFRCEDATILGNNDTMFSSTESKITIQLHLNGDPQFVWIAVSGMSVAHLYYFISLFLYLLSICLLLSYFAIYYYYYCYLSYISSRLWIFRLVFHLITKIVQ